MKSWLKHCPIILSLHGLLMVFPKKNFLFLAALELNVHEKPVLSTILKLAKINFFWGGHRLHEPTIARAWALRKNHLQSPCFCLYRSQLTYCYKGITGLRHYWLVQGKKPCWLCVFGCGCQNLQDSKSARRELLAADDYFSSKKDERWEFFSSGSNILSCWKFP